MKKINLDLWAIAVTEGKRIAAEAAPPPALGVNLKDTCRIFQVESDTIHRWTKDKSLSAIKVGERKTLFTHQSIAIKIAGSFTTSSICETGAFWSALPAQLTLDQVVEVLPHTFLDRAAICRALAQRRIPGRWVSGSGDKVEVAVGDLRRFIAGEAYRKSMFTTSDLEAALDALWKAPGGAGGADSPALVWGAWGDFAPVAAAEVELDDEGWPAAVEPEVEPDDEDDW